MKKSISVVSSIVVICISSLYAMELELQNLSKTSPSINGYGSLTAYVFNDIEAQKQILDESVTSAQIHDDTMLTFSLHKMCQYFNTMTENDKRIAIKNMPSHLFKSKKVSLLLTAVMILPPEVIQYVCLHMLDGEKDAAEQFWALPFLQAFDVYHEIKTTKTNDDQSVGSLYVKYLKARDLVLKVQKSPWYSYVPLISSEDKAALDLLDEDIKNSFLQEQEIFMTDEEFNTCDKIRHFSKLALPRPLCIVAIGVGIASCTYMTFFGMMSAIGATKMACSLPALPISILGSLSGGIVGACRIGSDNNCEKYAERVMSITNNKET